MKQFVSILTFLILACGAVTFTLAEENNIPNPVVRLQSLALPEFKVERVTLEEGLDVVRKAWSRRYPKSPFPVVVEDFRSRSDASLRATMHFKNVSALTAVTYLAQGAGMTVRHGLDMVSLRSMSGGEDDAWKTALISVSEVGLRKLGLPAAANDDKAVNLALQKRMESYGVRFESGFEIRWYGGNSEKRIFLRNTPEEIAKVEAVVKLIEEGYTLRKETK